MATTLRSGEQIAVFMELGFPVNVFTLGDYGTKVTRTNLVKNPSFETNTTGWTVVGSGSTFSRITTDAYVGSACVQVNKSAVVNGRLSIIASLANRIPVTAGLPYYVSAYVKVPIGEASCSLRIRTLEFRADGTQNAQQVSATTTVTDSDGWVRLSFADTPTGGATPTETMIFAVEESSGNARVFLVDACLFEQSATLRPYFDGSYSDSWTGYIQDGALSWSGTANASTSSGTWGLIGTEQSDGTSPTDASILDQNYLDGALLGDDVSPYIQSLSITRGRSSQLDQFSAGRCTVELLNNDRRFDPINEDSPYWDPATQRSGVVPRRKVTVQLNGIDVYVGRIADVDVTYDFNNLSTVTITAADDFVLLANAFTSSAFTPSEQLSGARVTALLDRTEIAYPVATRDIAAGTATFGAYQVDANTNALSYLQQCAEAERGLFYVAANGDLTFTNRVTSQFVPSIVTTFSDTGSDIPYQALEVIYGQEYLYNRIQVTRDSGTLQTANDATSQTEFGISTYALDNTLFSTDAQAATLADTLLSEFSEPRYRFDNMRVNLTGLSNVDRSAVDSLDIGDIIQITRTFDTGTPASVTQPYAIERIAHSLTSGSHVVEFGLRFATLVYQFILDDVTYGVLDADNALA